MDLIDLLPQLEAIARQINFQPLDDLLAQIRQIVDRLLLNILPHEPVRDGGAALEGYASRLDDLRGQIAAGIAGLQGVYAGPGADTYYASVTDALGQITRTRDHLNASAHHHYDLADHALEAAVQQGILIGQAGLMAFDLGSLVFTAGVDAPVSVPVAAGDAVAAVSTTAALDGAVDAAEVTVGVIGESAADLGAEAADLGAEGAEGLDAAADVSGDAAADAGGPGDVGGGGGGDETPPGGGGGDGAGDDPLYTKPQQYADQRARELQDALPEGSQGRVTMGTGVVEDSNGVRQVIVGTSEKNGYLRPAVKALLNPDDIVASGTTHAEQNIVQYALQNGYNVIAVGAGRPICEACEEVIVNAGGEDAIASATRSGFVPFWMRLLGM